MSKVSILYYILDFAVPSMVAQGAEVNFFSVILKADFSLLNYCPIWFPSFLLVLHFQGFEDLKFLNRLQHPHYSFYLLLSSTGT